MCLTLNVDWSQHRRLVVSQSHKNQAFYRLLSETMLKILDDPFFPNFYITRTE